MTRVHIAKMLTVREVSKASDIWKLMQPGLVTLYKPSGIKTGTVLYQARDKLVSELNKIDSAERYEQFHTSEAKVEAFSQKKFMKNILNPQVTLGAKYSSHPLVLGDLYEPDDLGIRHVNHLDFRASGLVLATLNAFNFNLRIRGVRLLRTYRIKAEIGKATDTGFIDGKVLEKSINPYLKRDTFISVLSAIQSSHQKAAFKRLNVSLQSQEAYEKAVKGPARAEIGPDPILYDIRCLSFNNPFLELEITCLNENWDFLVQFVSELGLLMKTNAVCHSVRCIRYGFFDLEGALLPKHVELQNVLQNIWTNKQLCDANLPKKRESHFSKPRDPSSAIQPSESEIHEFVENFESPPTSTH